MRHNITLTLRKCRWAGVILGAGLRGFLGHHVWRVIASYDGCADIVSAREIFGRPAFPGSHRATLG